MPPVVADLAEDLTHGMQPGSIPTLLEIMGSHMKKFFPNLEEEMAQKFPLLRQTDDEVLLTPPDEVLLPPMTPHFEWSSLFPDAKDTSLYHSISPISSSQHQSRRPQGIHNVPAKSQNTVPSRSLSDERASTQRSSTSLKRKAVAQPVNEDGIGDLYASDTTLSLDSKWLEYIRQMPSARSEAINHPSLSQIKASVKALSPKIARAHLKALRKKNYLYQGAGYRRMINDLGVTWEMVQLMEGLDNILPREVQHAVFDGHLDSNGYEYLSEFIQRTIKYHFGTTNQDSLLLLLYPEKKVLSANALSELRNAAMLVFS